MAKARVVKFCTLLGYIKFQQIDGKCPLKRSWSGSRDPFSVLTLNVQWLL